jgi:hypothetical protein
LALDPRSLFVGGRSMIDSLLSLGLKPLRSDRDDWSRVKFRSSGVIVAQAGLLEEVLLFWLPKHTTVWRVWFDQRCRRLPQDQCRIYYRQPFAAPTYLALDYFVSGLKTSVRTVDAALRTLDRAAEKLEDQLSFIEAIWVGAAFRRRNVMSYHSPLLWLLSFLCCPFKGTQCRRRRSVQGR